MFLRGGGGRKPSGHNIISGDKYSDVVVVYNNASGKSSLLASLGETGSKKNLEGIEAWDISTDMSWDCKVRWEGGTLQVLAGADTPLSSSQVYGILDKNANTVDLVNPPSRDDIV